MLSTVLEKPQTAPRITPMVMLTAPQINAMEMEIREPSQMASKVDWPEAPVPRIYLMFQPK